MSLRFWVVALVIIVAAVTAVLPEPPEPPRSASPPPSLAEPAPGVTVREVIDGRTVELSDGNRVRVSLLAAPAACWAEAALGFAQMTLRGKEVRVTSITPGEVTLTLSDDNDYALLAVKLGVLKTEGLDGGPLFEAETAAAQAKLGLWGEPCKGVPEAPRTTTPPPPVTTATTPPPPACVVGYEITSKWDRGFQAKVSVRNNTAADITGWTLRWTFADGESVQQMWDAAHSQSGAVVSAVNPQYATRIPAGGTVSFGFNGNLSRDTSVPTGFTLNGNACSVS